MKKLAYIKSLSEKIKWCDGLMEYFDTHPEIAKLIDYDKAIFLKDIEHWRNQLWSYGTT